MKHTIHFTPEGWARCLRTDALDLDCLGSVRSRRASHILPVNPLKRITFRLLRLLFGERGWVAAWTRRWSGPWEVILLHNKARRFIHYSRRACLSWEQDQINETL